MSYPSYSSQLLYKDALELANDKELLIITNIFDEKAKTPLPASQLVDEILRAGGNSFANTFRGHGVPYAELLHDTAEALKIEDLQALDSLTITGLTIQEMDQRLLNPSIAPEVTRVWRKALEDHVLKTERGIILKFIDDAYKRMTPEQREKVDRQVMEVAAKLPGKDFKGIGSSAGLLLVANAGGFATYMMLSTVISTLTGGLASFGIYTAASTALSVVLGPIGWTALGVASAYKLSAPNHQKTLNSIVAISMIKGRVSGQFTPLQDR